MRNLIHEIHRRSLWQVLGVYALASWIIYQVVVALWEGLGLPEWVPGTALVLLLIGLPIVLATAFVQEGAPGLGGGADGKSTVEGLERTSETAVHARSEGGEDAPTGPPDPPRSAPESGRSSSGALFTWSRAITGGVLAFAALGLATTGFMGMRALGIGPMGTLVARGELAERDVVVLADFGNATRDSLLGDVVTEALRIDLGQSPVIRVADPAQVSDVLRLMGRPDTARLDRDLAREVALRDGLKAVIAGEVGEAGGGYLLTAEVVAAADGRGLASFREAARDAGGLIDAIDRISRAIREKAGESLASTRASPPLERVTTASLPALRAYTRALRLQQREGDDAVVADLYREATQLDSTFAMAWRKLGVTLANVGLNPTERVQAISRAYQYRDRLPDSERHVAVGTYHHHLTGNYREGAQAYRRALDVDPENHAALHNLGIMYWRLRQYEAAEEVYQRAVTLHGLNYNYNNLVGTRYVLGKDSAAAATLDAALERHGDNLVVEQAAIRWAYVTGRAAVADSLAREMARGHPDSRTALLGSLQDRMALALLEGRLADARELHRQQARELSRAELHARSLGLAGDWALTEVSIRGDTAAAARTLEAALREHPLESLEPYDRPYGWLASVWARAGRPDRAAALLDAFERDVPAEIRGTDFGIRQTRAVIAMAEGDLEAAIAELETLDREHPCVLCPISDLATAYEAVGRAEDAATQWERYIETRYFYRMGLDGWLLGLALERAGELRERLGHTDRAARHNARLIELWRDADPELQPRVEAARRALARLAREGG